jgi:hypothetical protein
MQVETDLIGRSDADLGRIDPLEMNLTVAKRIPSLADLDVSLYKRQADRWSIELLRQLPAFEERFRRTPQEWDNDIHMFRLGVLCHFVHNDLGIRYLEDQKLVEKIAYTDPSDLFLNGVMDTRRGTCGNMAAFLVAMGWRLKWKVSLALAKWHCILRFGDGKVVWNIEASNMEGGFRTNPDEYYQGKYNIPQEHIDCGSDLAFLKPRELLGYFSPVLSGDIRQNNPFPTLGVDMCPGAPPRVY